MAVLTQNVAVLQGLQLFLAYLGHVGARGAGGIMDIVWFLWESTKISLCKLVSPQMGCPAGPGGAVHDPISDLELSGGMRCTSYGFWVIKPQ